VVTFGGEESAAWQAKLLKADGSHFAVEHQGERLGEVNWDLLGNHNVENALAAIAAAHHAGIAAHKALEALPSFKNVKRRMEIKGEKAGITVYDDFAHHPTAIATTLAGLRAKVGMARIVVVLEFASYTMRSGVHKSTIQDALQTADMVMCKRPEQDSWGLEKLLKSFSQPASLFDTVDHLVGGLAEKLKPGDHVVVMSNSGFGGIHQKLLNVLG
jgi:UDP-N-acetylmuramate: L-alanyl-gamma-D-glutamyl-meso-diaminopimelate ligase